ncbi:hypothetical protein PCANC_04397 [Puccinia coronata f. sp. avenae]|uniref:Uncharacterized protein n=1 Tax=Puccinia coronata f. sp. avenae TaxID=200324 RepID=A0A2N5T964_9BASI|nr:hypothetical protein PCANC_04397 [Puccinia coronata f. sp. avenae]
MGTRPSIGRFTLKAPVGRSMEASSGRFEIKAPVGRLMAASSGRYLTGAPVGRHHKASSGRSCQVAPIGRCHQASNGRFNLKAPTGRFHGASNGRFQAGRMQVVGLTLAEIILPRLSSPSSFHLVRTGLKLSIGRFRDASGTPPGRYAWTVRTSVLVEVNRGTVPTPPKFGRPMAVQRCAHWSSAGTRGVHVHAKYVAKWAAQLWAVSRRPHSSMDHWAARRLTATQVQVSPPVRLKVYDQNTNLLNYCASPNVNQCMLFSLGSHRERYEETPVRSRSKVFMSVACTALHRLQLYNKDHGQWPDESSPSSSSTCSNNNPKLNMH